MNMEQAGSHEKSNYAMDLRASHPEKMKAIESSVRQFIDTHRATGLLKPDENLNDKEISLVANLVANSLRRAIEANEDVTEDEMNKTIESALLTGVAERLHLKEQGMRAPEVM